MIGLALEWKRCPDGYELADLGERPESNGKSLLGDESQFLWGMYYRPRSDRRETFRLDLQNTEDPVAVKFVNARSDDDRLRFLRVYGPFLPGLDHVDTDYFPGMQAKMKSLLESACSPEASTSIAACEPILAKMRLRPGFDFGGMDGTPRLRLETNSLENYMRMECVAAALSQNRVTACENCGRVFLTGHSTGRRSHAKYCSDKCRVAAMRRRNTEGG